MDFLNINPLLFPVLIAVLAAFLIKMVLLKKDNKGTILLGAPFFTSSSISTGSMTILQTSLTKTPLSESFSSRPTLQTTESLSAEVDLGNNPKMLKDSLHHDVLESLLGDGIFTVDGEKWRQQRKLSSYEFSTRNLRDFSCGVFKSTAANLAHIISAAANSNQIIEIQALLMKSALDTVFKVVLSVDLDSTCRTNDGSQFSEAFDKASEITCYRYIDMLWPIKKFLNIGSEAKVKECIKIVNAFVYKVIESKMEQMSKPNQTNRSDILSRFLQMDQKDPKMKSLCGEDAEEFRPERWLDENGVFQQQSSFKFTAFQAGPRICLGKEFAYRQTKVIAAMLLSAFSFKLADETKPVNYRTMLTLQIDGGLHLRATSRIINKSNEQINTE
ncbi:cytochrome P450 [Striga asiatica]|uniref:Cytochrome P450 n=1 Tax=Striga asiatica TaxID=4170 RepID=A0A5A7PQG4_STRAF|nr:cytochrome P450 [Striga asiatica]